jgi:hypothetical protein
LPRHYLDTVTFPQTERKLILTSTSCKFDNELNKPPMSSIIEGFNYDIFISYYQKENQGDRWVSVFVKALKTELESTFREGISVYPGTVCLFKY